ncbi:MAG: SUMF1/EgtB/PvdO family nonheme iron enzyme [Planctomycetes bacterium]|nr:SUMF1/EgtB/PvdO family nonheme iron enzyme [Planctomycetota bacterium]
MLGRRLFALLVAGTALAAAGCGTSQTFEGHTTQDVFLAVRHVMDHYGNENVVGTQQGYVDWEDYDDSTPNQAVSFLTVGGFAHVSDHVRVDVEPTGVRQTLVTVKAGNDALFAFVPIPVFRGDIEKDVLARVSQRLEEMVHAQVREEEDLELRAIGTKVEYKDERLAARERADHGFGQVKEEELDRFSRGASDVRERYEELPERRPEGPGEAPGGEPRPDRPQGALEPDRREPEPERVTPEPDLGRDPEKVAGRDPRPEESVRPESDSGPGEPLPEAHARHEFRPFKERNPERPEGAAPGRMALVPGGEFAMGWGGGEPDEQPERRIYVSPFYIDIHEVTNAEYRRFHEWIASTQDHSKCHSLEPRGKTHRPRFWDRPGLDAFHADENPVVGVDWFDAYAYAAWAGKRLPTEAEWEKAARGTDGRRYPWGNVFRSDADNCSGGIEGSLERTERTDRYPAGASPYGVLSMGGNVSEWCLDFYSEDFYAQMPDSNPLNDRAALGRVLRGGSWKDPRELVRTTWRNYGQPDRYALYIGFRCVKDPE